jgi:hypothetical protein
MSLPTLCQGCGSVMPASGAHTCGCLDAFCDSPARVVSADAPESSHQNSGLVEPVRSSMASPAVSEPVPAPIQPMSEAEHSRFKGGRW